MFLLADFGNKDNKKKKREAEIQQAVTRTNQKQQAVTDGNVSKNFLENRRIIKDADPLAVRSNPNISYGTTTGKIIAPYNATDLNGNSVSVPRVEAKSNPKGIVTKSNKDSKALIGLTPKDKKSIKTVYSKKIYTSPVSIATDYTPNSKKAGLTSEEILRGKKKVSVTPTMETHKTEIPIKLSEPKLSPILSRKPDSVIKEAIATKAVKPKGKGGLALGLGLGAGALGIAGIGTALALANRKKKEVKNNE